MFYFSLLVALDDCLSVMTVHPADIQTVVIVRSSNISGNGSALAMWRHTLFVQPGTEDDEVTKVHCLFCSPALFEVMLDFCHLLMLLELPDLEEPVQDKRFLVTI